MMTMMVRVEMKEEVMVTSGYDDLTTEKCVCSRCFAVRVDRKSSSAETLMVLV